MMTSKTREIQLSRFDLWMLKDPADTSVFFSPRGEAMQECGDTDYQATIPGTAKLYKSTSSWLFAHESKLMNKKYPAIAKMSKFNTLQEVEDAYNGLDDDLYENPNLYYATYQKVAEIELAKLGYQGAEWTEEDELSPHQYQIWDKSIISNTGGMN